MSIYATVVSPLQRAECPLRIAKWGSITSSPAHRYPVRVRALMNFMLCMRGLEWVDG